MEIALSSFKYAPATLALKEYILHFVNRSGAGHDFVAKAFVEAARSRPPTGP